MKEEIKRWWNQAIEDLDTAQANLGIKILCINIILSTGNRKSLEILIY